MYPLTEIHMRNIPIAQLSIILTSLKSPFYYRKLCNGVSHGRQLAWLANIQVNFRIGFRLLSASYVLPIELLSSSEYRKVKMHRADVRYVIFNAKVKVHFTGITDTHLFMRHVLRRTDVCSETESTFVSHVALFLVPGAAGSSKKGF